MICEAERLLAMQKVEGSNPFSRSPGRQEGRKAAFAGLFRVCSRLVRLLRAGPKPDPREIDAYVRLEECGRLQGIWLVELLTPCEDDAEGHEFDPSGGPVSVRNRR